MDIYLWIDNAKELIRLPVLPSEFKINEGQNNETYDTVKHGEIKLIGLRKLATCSIESFFPDQNNDYTFVRDKTMSGIEYAKTILRWKDMRLPIRMIIPQLDINLPMTIESFEYGADTTTDIPYTLELSEFKFPQIKINPMKNKKGK
ncbi:hypothetical protein [Brevibacillus formosus]|uniref:Phage portal protein n=1 Tax=Brevibacillus formosus TaxID=54913 RepID=A0A220MHI2_9BACL|nr:hypothetical protein [Brevibacillus formosus]ASJ54405.1 hypothetical protein BP422_13070 [Brevibacillus formosus]